jgi:hypothetical protein
MACLAIAAAPPPRAGTGPLLLEVSVQTNLQFTHHLHFTTSDNQVCTESGARERSTDQHACRIVSLRRATGDKP